MGLLSSYVEPPEGLFPLSLPCEDTVERGPSVKGPRKGLSQEPDHVGTLTSDFLSPEL